MKIIKRGTGKRYTGYGIYALGRIIYPARCHETAAVDPHKVLELRFREYEKKGWDESPCRDER